jgi:M6 family metalloprotease-like protein
VVIPVVRVRPQGEPPDDAAAPPPDLFERATAWYARVSRGHCRLEFVHLSSVAAPRPLACYSGLGGKGRPPSNSQTLAAEAIRALAPADRDALARAGGRVLMVTPDDFLPHTWHLAGGGVPLGSSVWARRYSIAPASAALGTLVHELGHLALEWPDLPWPLDGERECLMARGATGAGAHEPAAPCAPLRLRAGWREPYQLTRTLAVRDLDEGEIASIALNGRTLLVEQRPGRLLICTTDPVPRLIARIALTPDDADRSLLGVVSPRLRGYDTSRRGRG